MDHNINISKYNPLAGSSFMKLPKELNHRRKVLLILKILMIMNALNGIKLYSTTISVFPYRNKEKYSIYVSKNCCEKKFIDLLLTGEKR